ncbi:hypothetical protein MCSF7_01109 [Mycoplasmopsis columbina SF7]|uniref:Uncharacterized protein n=1 Tax=Mycoplasmopsis columbina SF7 TaxID=1037410 RepID=F9UK15_9BACT|nr:hypothetical protein MCSF7_01109 [Mycoplasmopsis columbina SF7]
MLKDIFISKINYPNDRNFNFYQLNKKMIKPHQHFVSLSYGKKIFFHSIESVKPLANLHYIFENSKKLKIKKNIYLFNYKQVKLCSLTYLSYIDFSKRYSFSVFKNIDFTLLKNRYLPIEIKKDILKKYNKYLSSHNNNLKDFLII